MQAFDFRPTTRVIFGENSIDQLGAAAAELQSRQILLVTDPGIFAAGHVDRALESLQNKGIGVTVFKDVEENPTTRHVEKGVQFARETPDIDLIVGLGGGSAMDCAKGINFLLTNGGRMEDYWGIGKAAKPMLPSIGIPTTAGTGSEGQSFALISQEKTHRKMACGDLKARFHIVILDPTLLLSVPREVATVTGMDAISHALESYVTTKRNPISQMFAREAWKLLEKHFEIVLNEPDNIAAWGQMLLGAHFSGLAIENSMLGAAHATANPLTANYGITHGIAVGLMLPHVIKFNSKVVNGLYNDLAALVNGAGEGDVGKLLERLRVLKKNAGLPEKLTDFDVKEEDLPLLASQAAEQWTGNFNPRPLNEADLLRLYNDVYS